MNDLFAQIVDPAEPEQKGRFVERPYQSQAISSMIGAILAGGNPLLVMATGTGKSYVFSRIVQELSGGVMVLAHREELVNQNKSTLERVTGEPVGIEMADERANGQRIVSASVKSLNKKRLEKFDRSRFRYLVTDEAHHAASKSYKNIYNYFSSAQRIGVTATPDRKDKDGLIGVFDSIPFRYTIEDGVTENYLARPIGMRAAEEIDLRGLKTIAGDFSLSELDDKVCQAIVTIADAIVRECDERKSLVFVPSVKSALLLAGELHRRGFPAVALSGETEKEIRRSASKNLEDKSIKAIINCALFTEGTDIPHCDCVVMARPTQSRALFAQMVGRGLRSLPGKENCLLLEFTVNSDSHNLLTAFDLFAGSERNLERVRERAKKRQQTGSAVDLMLALDKEHEAIKVSFNAFDPLSFAEAAGIDVYGENDLQAWESDKLSPAQWGALLAAGFSKKYLKSLTKGQGSRILSHIKRELCRESGIEYKEAISFRELSLAGYAGRIKDGN